jgi:alkylation response protein AidB-like acyl-CoA dehydrogenase
VRRYGRVSFAGVRLDAGAVLGGAGEGAADAAWLERLAIVLQTAEMAGAAARCHEFTLEYMTDRYSFGRPLASYQALKHRMADAKLHLESSLALVDDAATAVGTAGVDGSGLAAAQRLTHATKAYVAQFAPEIIHECIQMHGGIGVTYEHDLHLFQRRATLGAGLLGTAEEHLQRLAALLSAPAEHLEPVP